MLHTRSHFTQLNNCRLNAKFLERPPSKPQDGPKYIRKSSRARWDPKKISLLLQITLFMAHFTELNRMERKLLRFERMKKRVPNLGCPKLDGIKWNDLQDLLQQNHGSGVNVYAIDCGPSSIPDYCTSFRDDFGNIDPYLFYQAHADAVLSILKGTEFSLAKDVKLHYFRLLHIEGFFKALDTIANRVVRPAVVTLSCYPESRNIYPKELKMITNALHTLINERQVPVVVAAGNDGTNSKPVNIYLDQLDFEGLWFIGNAQRIENTRRGTYWDINRKSQWGPWVKYYALGTNVRIQGMHSLVHGDGTSLSAPVTAAYIARILSLFPDARIDQIETILDGLALNEVFSENLASEFEAKVIPLFQPEHN